ncbi:hypothetical protein GCM10017690_25760 [Microbacterium terregens]
MNRSIAAAIDGEQRHRDEKGGVGREESDEDGVHEINLEFGAGIARSEQQPWGKTDISRCSQAGRRSATVISAIVAADTPDMRPANEGYIAFSPSGCRDPIRLRVGGCAGECTLSA